MNTAQAGWQCGACGAWIPYGQSHHCPNVNYTYSYYPYIDNQILERIASALERIANQLESKDAPTEEREG